VSARNQMDSFGGQSSKLEFLAYIKYDMGNNIESTTW
jgi:hypothetical protein